MNAEAKRISDILYKLMDCARELLSMAEEMGAEEAEVFGLEGRSVDVDLRRSEVELASESFFRGLGLRAVVNGAVGFSSTNDLRKLDLVARSAVRSARVRGSDDLWQSLPQPKQVHAAENIFDISLSAIGPAECMDLADGMLKGCQSVKGAAPVSGGVICISGTEFVLNSHGVELSSESTSMHASVETIAKGSDVATGIEFHNSRQLESDLSQVGRKAAEMAAASLNGDKARSGTFDVILQPLAFVDLLQYAFLPSISADNVQKKRSSLAGRAGEAIASSHLAITDDGLLSGGLGTSPFDGEGVPAQRNKVIENGILKGFLYDSYTAGKVGLDSTGNAVRAGYSELPRVGIRNLVVRSDSPFDLQEDARGFLVNGLIGAHTANPISGDFSVEARNSFFIAPGEAPRPVKSMMLAGNIFDVFQDIGIGTDARAVGAIVTPSVKARVKVIGS